MTAPYNGPETPIIDYSKFPGAHNPILTVSNLVGGGKRMRKKSRKGGCGCGGKTTFLGGRKSRRYKTRRNKTFRRNMV